MNPAWWSAWTKSKSAWCWAAIAISKSRGPRTWSWRDCSTPKRWPGRPHLENERPRMSVPEIRTGLGWDVHRIVPGRPLILGGVTIPSEFGLDGHSDADILLHAVTDALLGAAALGDIGMHFPDTDPRWKGAASAKFLE